MKGVKDPRIHPGVYHKILKIQLMAGWCQCLYAYAALATCCNAHCIPSLGLCQCYPPIVVLHEQPPCADLQPHVNMPGEKWNVGQAQQSQQQSSYSWVNLINRFIWSVWSHVSCQAEIHPLPSSKTLRLSPAKTSEESSLSTSPTENLASFIHGWSNQAVSDFLFPPLGFLLSTICRAAEQELSRSATFAFLIADALKGPYTSFAMEGANQANQS